MYEDIMFINAQYLLYILVIITVNTAASGAVRDKYTTELL